MIMTLTHVNGYQEHYKVLTAKEYFNLPSPRPYAYVDLNGQVYNGLYEVVDIDENLAGTEQYIAFKDNITGQLDWVNATNKDIMVDNYAD